MAPGRLKILVSEPLRATDNRIRIFRHFTEALLTGEMYKYGIRIGQKVKVISNIHGLEGQTLIVAFACRSYFCLQRGIQQYGVTINDLER